MPDAPCSRLRICFANVRIDDIDPLSDILSLLKPQSSISAGLDAGGDWSIHFPGHEGIKFNAVMRGACWVFVEGDSAPRRIEEGDCFLLTKGRPFTFATDLSLPSIQPHTIYDQAQNGVAVCNGGGDFFLIGGRFTFAGENADVLFDALPPIIHIKGGSSHASVMHWALDQLAAELREPRQGATLVGQHLAHIMLVQILRIHLTSAAEQTPGWFRALADRQLSRTLGALHAEPARPWTVAELAGIAGMSRTTFAERFKQMVGLPPLDYLTRWRMLVAADRLKTSRDSISSIGLSVGYESGAAFSTAFKKHFRQTPRQIRLETVSAMPHGRS